MRRGWPVAATSAAGAVLAYRVLLRPWHERWGATNDEVQASLPGDELVAAPARQITRAIAIDAPPDTVWPWVVQLGADRAGFYSYDWLENLAGLDIHSSDRVVSEWQQRSVGDLVYANAAGTSGWYVVHVVPNEALVLKMADVPAGRPARRDGQLRWEFLWTFVLEDSGSGTSRLLVRERVAFASGVTQLLMAPFGFVSFVMTQKMLRGIKERAEATRAQQTASAGRP